jgi:hypothetical protein
MSAIYRVIGHLSRHQPPSRKILIDDPPKCARKNAAAADRDLIVEAQMTNG